ncbi:hypothetical protein [Sphingobium olei]|uniref:Uncharacterized protein n=1 Tax=Sphingobium olei TaxID=420955 RepID=A0ABW3NZV0_9SPHN|nr:hypothetical protein [Sphingobium sp.]
MVASIDLLPPIAAEPIEPFSIPILLDDNGCAWIPDGFQAGCFRLLPVGEGASLGWAPIPEMNKALISIWGGNPFAPTGEAIAIAISRRGLRGIIAGLQSIDAQMEGM